MIWMILMTLMIDSLFSLFFSLVLLFVYLRIMIKYVFIIVFVSFMFFLLFLIFFQLVIHSPHLRIDCKC